MNVRRRPFGLPDVAVPTGTESAELDRYAIEDLAVPQRVLMENAGRSVATAVQGLFPRGEVVGVVGKGNNGGDALVALRTLAAWGRSVRAVLVGERETADLLHGWSIPVHHDSELDDGAWDALLARGAPILDGILGTGISGAPRDRQASVIRRINAAAAPILALDVPSGVDADSGAVPGEAVAADVTVCFGHPKLGALLHPGRGLVGRLLSVEIGFPPADPAPITFSARLATPGWASARFPTRDPDTHKNAVGALLVVAGSPGMAGAAVLAARAALRAGAGMVRVASPGANRSVLQATVPEAVFVDAEDRETLRSAVRASRALVVGPGLGTDNAATSLLNAVLRDAGERPLLVDADGLNIVAGGAVPVSDLVGGRPVILTPHPGEMARLVDATTEDVVRDRPGTARSFASANGCTVLLKGAPSLVAAPGRPLLLDSAGSSALAVGGMGDVLSGVIGALLAQGLEPWEAGGVGLFASGRAASLAGGGSGLLPTDVAEKLPVALREEGDGDTDLVLPGLLLDQDPAR